MQLRREKMWLELCKGVQVERQCMRQHLRTHVTPSRKLLTTQNYIHSSHSSVHALSNIWIQLSVMLLNCDQMTAMVSLKEIVSFTFTIMTLELIAKALGEPPGPSAWHPALG